MKVKKKRRGQVINHSQRLLLVIETDTGRPIVHQLGPKHKSPINVDADGFKRADGRAIFLHKQWWKIGNISTADIWQIGDDVLIPISLMVPVSDDHFGAYTEDKTPGWGEKLAYVTAIIRNKKREVTGYVTESFGRISKKKAIDLAKAGRLDNVVVVENKLGTVFLRTKKNVKTEDNLVS